MKKILAVLLVIASTPAFAATGFLINCVVGTGPGGGTALIGTYRIGHDGTVTMYFPMGPSAWCPPSVNVP